ncbi:MAG: PQQ-binding-like beta-propeller repeat protein [Myxococcales bacterium]|nr:PQQ-binding-like beta-propeller repeat protein [Myxococcales bacterium]
MTRAGEDRLVRWAWFVSFGLSLVTSVSLSSCEVAPTLRRDGGTKADPATTTVKNPASLASEAGAGPAVLGRGRFDGCEGTACELGETLCDTGVVLQCQVDTRGCPAMIEVAHCTAGCAAADGVCAGCNNECEPADTRCVDENSERTCEVTEDGCLRWSSPRACDDGIDCTVDGCSTDIGRCEYVPDDNACEHEPQAASCTRVSCSHRVGCERLHIDGVCDDGSVCTTGDHCVAGACVGDLVANMSGCTDRCPDDPLKHEPGMCGCGVAEQTADSDDDGLLDCNDPCPNEPCQGEGPLGCKGGVQRTCMRNEEGCFRLDVVRCDNQACWDADRCASVTRVQLKVGVRLGEVSVGPEDTLYFSSTPTSGSDEFCAIGVAVDGSVRGNTCTLVPDARGLGPVAVAGSGELVRAGQTWREDVQSRAVSTGGAVVLWTHSAQGTALEWQQPAALEMTEVFSNVQQVLIGGGSHVLVSGTEHLDDGPYEAVVVALDRANGQRVWSRRWPESMTGSHGGTYKTSMATDGSSIYVAITHDGYQTLNKLRGSNGEVLWSKTLRLEGSALRVAANSSGVVALASARPDNHLRVYGASGEVLWMEPLGEGCHPAHVLVAEDSSILTLCKAQATVFDADGETKFEFRLNLWAGPLDLATGLIADKPAFVIAGYPNGDQAPRAVIISPR